MRAGSGVMLAGSRLHHRKLSSWALYECQVNHAQQMSPEMKTNITPNTMARMARAEIFIGTLVRQVMHEQSYTLLD